ncbi:MAG: hypothetical protein JWR69_884 [Pedosphaera sp.]|nr:hypothetical protein [Pedosphaera sp.]
MSTAWSKLVEIRERIPVAGLGVSLDVPVNTLPLIGESPYSLDRFGLKQWFKIAPHQFIHTRYDAPQLFGGFAWAPSDGALALALTGDTFFDDDATQIPPSDLLPDGRSYDLPNIARLGGESGDSHFSNVQLETVHEVYFRRFYYYYRDCSTKSDEPPFCIRVVPTEGLWLESCLLGMEK